MGGTIFAKQSEDEDGDAEVYTYTFDAATRTIQGTFRPEETIVSGSVPFRGTFTLDIEESFTRTQGFYTLCILPDVMFPMECNRVFF